MAASPPVKSYQCLFPLSIFKEHTNRVFIYLCGSLTMREPVFNMASSHCVTFAKLKELHSLKVLCITGLEKLQVLK